MVTWTIAAFLPHQLLQLFFSNVWTIQVVHNSALHFSPDTPLLFPRYSNHLQPQRKVIITTSKQPPAPRDHGLALDLDWCPGQRRECNYERTAARKRTVRARRLHPNRGAARDRGESSTHSRQACREAPLARRPGRDEVLPQHPVQRRSGLEQPLHCLQQPQKTVRCPPLLPHLRARARLWWKHDDRPG